MELPVFTVSQFVDVVNSTFEFALTVVTIQGEISNMRVSRGKWVYFDIKDEGSSVKCFGTVYVLPGPLEDGMSVRIEASPRLHNLYGFSLNLRTVAPVGQGSIKKASDLLAAKLTSEGLFEKSRKRVLTYPPSSVALVTSKESAAYKDFIKIMSSRWPLTDIKLLNVQVQGVAAIEQIVSAIAKVSTLDPLPEVLVLTRGGGSVDDLSVWSSEQVVRAIAASRVPTMVAIGHEQDISLAELSADVRASTPSNAAELLVPDRQDVLAGLIIAKQNMASVAGSLVAGQLAESVLTRARLFEQLCSCYKNNLAGLIEKNNLLELLNPKNILARGYAVVRLSGGKVVRNPSSITSGAKLSIELAHGLTQITVQ